MKVKINWRNILLVVLLAVYLLFLYIPNRVSSAIRFFDFKKGAVMTEGKADSVYMRWTNKDEGYHREWEINYSYNVGGEEYRGTAKQAFKPVQRGDVLKIYYRPENPSESAADISANIMRAVYWVCIIAVYAAFLLYREMKNYFYGNKLIAENKYIISEPCEEIRAKSPYFISPRYKTVCEYKDENRVDYTFETPPYLAGKCPIKAGQRVKIYVDLENRPKKYYFSPEEV